MNTCTHPAMQQPSASPTTPAATPHWPDVRRNCLPLRQGQGMRWRDVAEHLLLSEGELVAAHAGLGPTGTTSDTCGHGAGPAMHSVRLRPQWPQLVASLAALGPVMALTRNASCVHEKNGVYHPVSQMGRIGLVQGPDIDLRLFYSHWAHAFAVSETTPKGLQRSVQFFDAHGCAVHKVFLTTASHTAAHAPWLAQWADADQCTGMWAAAPPPEPQPLPDCSIDVQGLRLAWTQLRDVHAFFGLLKRFGVTRRQALQLADPEFVQPVDTGSAHPLLQQAAQQGLALMVFVGNPGGIQIHTGPVQHIAVVGQWLNVLDGAFNLHLRQDHIDSAWVVRKPTADGVLTSLELFDRDGRLIALFFGHRTPGQPESGAWRELVNHLHTPGMAAQQQDSA